MGILNERTRYLLSQMPSDVAVSLTELVMVVEQVKEERDRLQKEVSTLREENNKLRSSQCMCNTLIGSPPP